MSGTLCILCKRASATVNLLNKYAFHNPTHDVCQTYDHIQAHRFMSSVLPTYLLCTTRRSRPRCSGPVAIRPPTVTRQTDRRDIASHCSAYYACSISLSSRVSVGQITRSQVLTRHPCPVPTPTVHLCHVLSACECSGCSWCEVALVGCCQVVAGREQ